MTDFMTSEEIAKRLGCTRQNVARLAAAGLIPYVRQGRNILVPRGTWDRWLEKQGDAAMAAVKEPTNAA